MKKPRPLFPPSKAYASGFLSVGDGHKIYWEAGGNPKGIPALFLHGGPGSGSSPSQRQRFNPKKFNIIIFDQRGCGKSTPHASLKNNATPHLIDDIEKLRKRLNIDKWFVFGGSWGSTLALAYADKHPDKILALLMYGIFLCRESELKDMYYNGGIVSRVFSDVFEKYLSLLPKKDQKYPVKGYQKLFKSKNQKTRRAAVKMWTQLETKVCKLVVPDDVLKSVMKDYDFVLSHSLLENHYFVNKGFIDGKKILKTIGRKLKNIPVHIVQGRYDMVCPFTTAWELHKAIPKSRLHIIDDAGHASKEPGTQEKLLELTELLGRQLKKNS